jgi:hypothetical protein
MQGREGCQAFVVEGFSSLATFLGPARCRGTPRKDFLGVGGLWAMYQRMK